MKSASTSGPEENVEQQTANLRRTDQDRLNSSDVGGGAKVAKAFAASEVTNPPTPTKSATNGKNSIDTKVHGARDENKRSAPVPPVGDEEPGDEIQLTSGPSLDRRTDVQIDMKGKLVMNRSESATIARAPRRRRQDKGSGDSDCEDLHQHHRQTLRRGNLQPEVVAPRV